MRCLAVLLAGLLLAPAASAQFGSGFYMGLGYGVFQFEDEGEDGGDPVDDTAPRVPFSDTAPSYKLLVGYNIHEALAVELGFAKSGGFREALIGVTSGIELDLDVDYDVRTVRVLVMAPFSGVDMFGGIGYYDGDVKFTNLYRSPLFGEIVLENDASISGLTVIGGVQFHLDRLIIRGEYEWFDDDKGVATAALNIGVVIPFGRQ